MPKRRIPDRPPNCETCSKPKGGKGWFGPGCMCDVEAGHAADQAHSIPLNITAPE